MWNIQLPNPPRYFGQTNKQSAFRAADAVSHLLTLKGSKCQKKNLYDLYEIHISQLKVKAHDLNKCEKNLCFKVCGKNQQKNQKEVMFTLHLNTLRWMRAACSSHCHTAGRSLPTTLRNSLQPRGFSVEADAWTRTVISLQRGKTLQLIIGSLSGHGTYEVKNPDSLETATRNKRTAAEGLLLLRQLKQRQLD